MAIVLAERTAELTLHLTPDARFDVIDVSARVKAQQPAFHTEFRKALYCSYHTTAGYFEQSLCQRLLQDRTTVEAFVQSYQQLFPPMADYRHDQLDLRTELSEEQRCVEPRNADSHLTFIGSGLENCVTYQNAPDTPVYFVDLDGVNGQTPRNRRTTVVGFNEEEVVDEVQLAIPVSNHPIDSINLRDDRLGLFEQLHDLLKHYEIVKGRVDIALEPEEEHAGLTVNEFETLLMQHDLVDVLRDPLRFMAQKGRSMLRNPKAIPSRAKEYAKYDLVQVVNEFLDKVGLSESLVERIIDKFLAMPASHFLHMKRSVSLPVLNINGNGCGAIVQGTYQSPILVQWKRAAAKTRHVNVRFVRFD